MAKQRGIIKLDGTIDDLTFVRTRDGFIAKQKTSLNAARIASDPAFARTRENGAEFGRAGKAGKLLRTAFRTQLLNARDSRTTSRLTREMMHVIKTDPVNLRGQRNVMEGEKSLLQDFDFNANAQLSTTLFAPYSTAIDRAAGQTTLTIPPFIPANMIVAPVGTTHFLIHTAAATIDFDSEIYEVNSAASQPMPWDGTATALLTLTCNLAAGSTLPLFLVLGIEFFQEVNGTNYALKNGTFNALTIVAVD